MEQPAAILKKMTVLERCSTWLVTHDARNGGIILFEAASTLR